MHRWDFIRAVAGSAMAWPLASGSQQPAMPVVGYLGSEAERFGIRLSEFRGGSAKQGLMRAEMSQSNIVGRMVTSIDCRHWRPILSALGIAIIPASAPLPRVEQRVEVLA